MKMSGSAVGWMLLGALWLSGCGDGRFSDMQVDAQKLLRVEDTAWDSADGKYVHDLTLVNGSDVGAKDIVIRFRYLDGDGKEIGTAEHTFPSLIEAHSSARMTGIEGGATSGRIRKVEHEVVKVKATWKGRKKS